VQIPFIVDPNTGVEMFETKEIQEYLRETYGA
jgi:glutathione S-transferase